MFNKIRLFVLDFAGLEWEHISHAERLISTLGGFFGILMIYIVSHWLLGEAAAVWMVASMGASAVLLFGVPHGKLSQPWALLGGHVSSALVGVTCASLIDSNIIAAALAVGLAIGVMHYLRCLHPPGGATALVAVIGGDAISQLGYLYVLIPVLLNTVIILFVAVTFNALFSWRRYPSSFNRLFVNTTAEQVEQDQLDPSDLKYALEKMDLVVDISEKDLVDIYRLAQQHANASQLHSDEIELGKYFSNGRYGETWAVRRIIDVPSDTKSDKIIYRTVAGQNRGKTGVCSREEFAQWAKHEVFLNENSWQKVNPSEQKELL